MSGPAHLLAARAWREQDPDAATRAELDALLSASEGGDADAAAGLADRFGSRLAFGTAGLRGELGAGPNRMNRVLVAQAAAGLAAYLLDAASRAVTDESGTGNPTAPEDHHGRHAAITAEPPAELHRADTATRPSVVIGYDGRRNSEVFARDTAEIMAGAGLSVTLFSGPVPTPVLAYAVRRMDAAGGVMVTASHNPRDDNGYKVYLGGDDRGSQIVPPADASIASFIDRAAAGRVDALPRSDRFALADESVIEGYIAATAAIATRPSAHPVVVHTAMHGVGWHTLRRVFAAAGLPEPVPVPEQSEPDGAFPTLPFPNPEEPGALDLAFRTATEVAADLVIASDPDADRMAVGIRSADGWRRLSGNEVGMLLGWRAAKRAHVGGVLAASIVSSPALREIASAYDLGYRDTLTGFKWISRVPGLCFGYEEALGYLVNPSTVRDKDGISAAIDFVSLVGELMAAGTTVDQHLDAFAAKFGAHASDQISVRVDDLDDIARMMARLRELHPTSIGPNAVERVDDFAAGVDGFPPSDVLRYWLADDARVIVRPSGTEPKLKVYLDAASADGDPSHRWAAARAAVAALGAGIRELLGIA